MREKPKTAHPQATIACMHVLPSCLSLPLSPSPLSVQFSPKLEPANSGPPSGSGEGMSQSRRYKESPAVRNGQGKTGLMEGDTL